MGTTTKLRFCILGMLFLAVGQNVKAATVNSNGGYDITIVVDEQVVKTNPERYIENLKGAINKLSNSMKIATENFWIKSAKVVVPSTWDVVADGNSGTLHYKNADIRLSSSVDYPYVLNPNLCRLPGDYMELPDTFFDVANRGEYGDLHKVLLNQWARLRWGVWEEHGYPGDAKFPYFYQNENGMWEVTGCFDAPLMGDFKTLAGVDCDPSAATIDQNCRFFPWNNNTATQSIMSFHDVYGIERFCDQRNPNALNRQNLYCNYESAMQTIQNSVDMAAVNASEVPSESTIVNLQILKAPRMPPFHIILDKGAINADEARVQAAVHVKLAKFIDSLAGKDANLVGLSTYPINDQDTGLVNKVDLGLFGEDDRKNRIVNELISVNIEEVESRDFGRVLQLAAAQISDISPVTGGVILLVKTGGASNSSDFSTERDTQVNLQTSKVKLFAIEISGPEDVRLNLQNVAIATYGESYAANSVADVNVPEFQIFLNTVGNAFGALPDVPSTATLRTPWRGQVTGGVAQSINVPTGAESLTFHFSHPEDIDVTAIQAGFMLPQINFTADFIQETEYSNVNNPNNRYLYTAKLDLSRVTAAQVTFNYVSAQKLPGNLIVTAEGRQIAADIVINVKTTAVNNVVDLAKPVNINQPFGIFAEITQGGIPVANANVTCKVWSNGTMVRTLQLVDDGASTQDVAENDGIYSVVFVPQEDGIFTFDVEATRQSTENIRANKEISTRAYLSLMPIDQNFTRPGKEATDMPNGITAKASLGTPVTIMNRASYVYVIPQIKDLTVTVNAANVSKFEFRFTKPKVIGTEEETTGFRVFRGDTKDDVIGLNISAPTLPNGVEELKPEGSTAEGSVLTVRYNSIATENRTSYVGIVASFEAISSGMSNVEAMDEKALEGGEEGDPEVEEGKGWIKSTGGVITVVAIVVIVFAAAGGGYWYMKKKRSARTSAGGSA